MTCELSADPGCCNLQWSLALFRGLQTAGLRQVVLSPGSRSTPLVLAAQRLAGLTLTPIVDERSAAFFALGLARAGQAPVALVCTSGSAPAHWYPAVIEASQWGLPLVLLSADRPPELRGWGANQTIEQTRLFGGFVQAFHDPGPAAAGPAAWRLIEALGRRVGQTSLLPVAGPVHVNLPFREPLVPAGDCPPPPATPALPATTMQAAREPAVAGLPADWQGRRGLIVCGPEQYAPALAPALWACAKRLGVPVLLDPLAGLRWGAPGAAAIAHYDSFLRNPEVAAALRPDWVIQFGAAPVSKTLQQWLAGIPTLGVDPAGRWRDPNHAWLDCIQCSPQAFCQGLATSHAVTAEASWLKQWQAVDQRCARWLQDYLATAPWCEGHVIQALLGTLPAGHGLLCANSMPIRQLDTWSGMRPEPLAIFGNRGCSGIDGQLSTLAGLNAAGVPTLGLLGDLSFSHDLGGLWLAAHWHYPLVVINNDGGRIFDYLPQAGQPEFERLWRTPLPIDWAGLARAFGLVHRRVTAAADLTEALQTLPAQSLLEVAIDGAASQQVHRGLWQQLAQADLLPPPD